MAARLPPNTTPASSTPSLSASLRPSPRKFQRNRMDFAVLILDEHPDVLVALEPLRQFLFHSGAAGCRGGCWCGAHDNPPFLSVSCSSAQQLGFQRRLHSVKSSDDVFGDRFHITIPNLDLNRFRC